MTRATVCRICLGLSIAILAGACGAGTPPEALDWSPDPDGEWTAYARDAGGTKYSPLTQLHVDNVAELEVAWTARTGDFASGAPDDGTHGADGVGPDGQPADPRAGGRCGACHGESIRFETTPLMVGGRLLVSTPGQRVLSLDPATGAQHWVFDTEADLQRGYSEDLISRGVSVWSDSEGAPGESCVERVFVANVEAKLFALDRNTGELCEDFGRSGVVALDEGVGVGGRRIDPGDYLVTSPPAIAGDVLVVGSAIGDNRRRDVESGVVRGYDTRTGELRWSFDPIPRSPESPGWEGWSEEATRTTGAANVWSIISADPARGLVFLPTGSAAPDFYGGDRPGRNDFANSVVALRASTGEVVWSFQVVHHDIWDYDVASQPVLIELEHEGGTIPAVVVGTKMGTLFVLHRETGEPVYPVEERPVPASDVPGETAWPTQPFSVGLPALHETVLTPDSAFGITDDERAFCANWMAQLRNEGVFTPPSLEGTLMWPGFGGGMNWDGASWDPHRQMLVVPVKRLAMFVQLHERTDFERATDDPIEGREYARQGGTPYGMSRMPLIAPSGLPCSPPPWSKLVGVDLSEGRIAWERPHGGLPPVEGAPPSEQPPEAWGSVTFGGPLSTAGGVTFIAGGMDDRIRAYATETGELLWTHDLPAGGQAAPMTYRINGKQYVVITAGGRSGIGTSGDYVVAFALPGSP